LNCFRDAREARDIHFALRDLFAAARRRRARVTAFSTAESSPSSALMRRYGSALVSEHWILPPSRARDFGPLVTSFINFSNVGFAFLGMFVPP
jgi:hypothetical protein